jgi:acetolactate synthase-1/2/3 large subunit
MALITPITDALADGTPLVVFSGQVATSSIGLDGFQEADILGMSMPCTKWNVAMREIAQLPRCIKQAFDIATSGRPGPILVELPIDITAGILRKHIQRSDMLPSVSNTLNVLNKIDIHH